MFISNKLDSIAFGNIEGQLFHKQLKLEEKIKIVEQFYDPEGKSTLTQNFTAQSFERNKQPVYYSLIGPQNQLNQTIIWWNKENDTWLGEIRSYDQERGDFSIGQQTRFSQNHKVVY